MTLFHSVEHTEDEYRLPAGGKWSRVGWVGIESDEWAEMRYKISNHSVCKDLSRIS